MIEERVKGQGNWKPVSSFALSRQKKKAVLPLLPILVAQKNKTKVKVKQGKELSETWAVCTVHSMTWLQTLFSCIKRIWFLLQQNAQEIKRTLFNNTEQAKTWKFSMQSSFSSYIQNNRKLLNQTLPSASFLAPNGQRFNCFLLYCS